MATCNLGICGMDVGDLQYAESAFKSALEYAMMMRK